MRRPVTSWSCSSTSRYLHASETRIERIRSPMSSGGSSPAARTSARDPRRHRARRAAATASSGSNSGTVGLGRRGGREQLLVRRARDLRAPRRGTPAISHIPITLRKQPHRAAPSTLIGQVERFGVGPSCGSLQLDSKQRPGARRQHRRVRPGQRGCRERAGGVVAGDRSTMLPTAAPAGPWPARTGPSSTPGDATSPSNGAAGSPRRSIKSRAHRRVRCFEQAGGRGDGRARWPACPSATGRTGQGRARSARPPGGGAVGFRNQLEHRVDRHRLDPGVEIHLVARDARVRARSVHVVAVRAGSR